MIPLNAGRTGRKVGTQVIMVVDGAPWGLARTFAVKVCFLGSRAVRADYRSLIGLRLEQSGTRWTIRGADALVARPLAADTHKFVAHRLGRVLDPTGPGR